MTQENHTNDPKAQTTEQAIDAAQAYVRKMIDKMLRSNLGGNVAELALRLLIEHDDFEYWTKLTREQREAGLPEDKKAAVEELDRRFDDAKYVFAKLMPMVADPKGFDRFLGSLRGRGINIVNEPLADSKGRYYIGLRGDYGWLHLYNAGE